MALHLFRVPFRDRDRAWRFFVVQVSGAQDHVSQSVARVAPPNIESRVTALQGNDTCSHLRAVHAMSIRQGTVCLPRQQGGLNGVYGVYGAPESRNARSIASQHSVDLAYSEAQPLVWPLIAHERFPTGPYRGAKGNNRHSLIPDRAFLAATCECRGLIRDVTD
jgi:hypothetical protein